jgi:hypothetical protein
MFIRKPTWVLERRRFLSRKKGAIKQGASRHHIGKAMMYAVAPPMLIAEFKEWLNSEKQRLISGKAGAADSNETAAMNDSTLPGSG